MTLLQRAESITKQGPALKQESNTFSSFPWNRGWYRHHHYYHE